MKIIYCTSCDSMVRLITSHRQCECGKVGGQYVDSINAIYYGKSAFPMGIDNKSFGIRLRKQVDENTYYNIANRKDMDSSEIKCFAFGKGDWCSNGVCGDTAKFVTKKEYLKLTNGICQ